MGELFDPDRHEPLSGLDWDPDRARTAIEAIAGDACRAFTSSGLWPLHPDDAEPGETQPHTQVYFGAAGVILGLSALSGAADIDISVFARHLPAIAERNRKALEEPAWRKLLGGGQHSRSWLMGDAGASFLRWRLLNDPDGLPSLKTAVAGNQKHPSRELMWGSPGTLLAALAVWEETGAPGWGQMFTEGVDILVEALEAREASGCEVWTQRLYGRDSVYLGLGHGFAGAAMVILKGRRLLGDERWTALAGRLARTMRMTAVRAGGLLNWPASPVNQPGRPLLLQQCHGAPGVITGFAEAPCDLDDVLLPAGELVWKAGPLSKGAGLCHGTAGNGLALLKLFVRTGDELWLARARLFAMHALEQSEARRRALGRGRYSLWTGDVGLAVFLLNCLEGAARFPSLDL